MKHPPIVIVQTSSRSWHLAHLTTAELSIPVYALAPERYADALDAIAEGHRATKAARTDARDAKAAPQEGGPA